MSKFVDWLVNVGFDAGKDHFKMVQQEQEAKKHILQFIERQEKINELCAQAEEIDFQALTEYMTKTFLDDVEKYLFGMPEKRNSVKQTILTKACDYARAQKGMAIGRVEQVISDSLDILHSYYYSQMSRENMFLLAEIAENTETQMRKHGERMIEVVNVLKNNQAKQNVDDQKQTCFESTHVFAKNEKIKSLHQFVMKNYIKERYKRGKLSKEDIENYSRLFKQTIEIQKNSKGVSDFETNIFDYVRENIISKDTNNLIKVIGPDGTGKSTFLSLLYIYLYRYCMNEQFEFHPFYINLHYYDTKIPPTTIDENEIKEIISRDLRKLEEVVEIYPNIPYIIIIDGNENYSKTIFKLSKCFRELIEGMSGYKKILCIGEKTSVHEYRKNTPRSPYHGYPRMLYTFKFKSISIYNQKQSEEFVQSFVSIEKNEELTGIICSYLKEWDLEEIDLSILNIFKQCYDSDVLSTGDSVSNLYKNYCVSYLGDAEKINDVAQMAYDYFINNKQLDQKEISNRNREWNLIHQHKTVSNFLIAYCYVEKLKQYKKNNPVDDMEYLFPTGVNVFIKALINENIDTQGTIFEQCKTVYDEGGVLSKAQTLYIMGRINSKKLKQKIIKVLQGYYQRTHDDLFKNLNRLSEQEVMDNHLLLRSIIISLVYLGEKDKGKIYLKLLLECRIANQINRGFHLEYYGDIPRKPDNNLYNCEDDGSSNMKVTYDVLTRQIKKHLDAKSGTENVSFQINLFTLCSLVQMRLSKQQMDENSLNEVQQIICIVLDKEQNNIDKNLKAYLQMLKEDIENKTYSPYCMYDKLHKIKNIERTGWKDEIKGDKVQRPYENVAEHIYYTWILGVLYLPQDAPDEDEYKDYNKKQVLDAILIHDWAEVDVGDVVPKKQDEAYREKQDFRMRVLLMHDTYEDIGGLTEYKNAWSIFGKESGNINGQLAYELDKIQALYQFYLYEEQGAVFTDEKAKDWISEKDKITTSLGKSILKKVLQERFENFR